MTQTPNLDFSFMSRLDAYYPFYKNYPVEQITALNICSDMEWVKKLTEARFLETKSYPKARKLH